MVTAAVVGAGPNGLAAAITLAEAGAEVDVYEANRAPGGAVRTSERLVDGLRFDDYSTAFPLTVASPFFAAHAAELADAGLRWARPAVELAHPLDDGSTAVMLGSVAATAEALGGAEGRRWHRLFAPFADERAVAELVGDALGPVLRWPDHPWRFARFAVRSAAPVTLVARTLGDGSAAALFAGIAAHSAQPLSRPIVGGIGLLLGAVGQVHGWPTPVGGAQSITDALVAVCRARGIRIHLGTPIDDPRQLTVAGRAPDVTMLDVSAGAAARLTGGAHGRRWRTASLRRQRPGPAAFGVSLAVDGGVPWSNERCSAAGTLHLGGSAAAIAAGAVELSHRRLPSRPYVVVGQAGAADQTRIVGGVHPISAYTHCPNGYDGDPEALTASVIAEFERNAPGLTERLVGVEWRTAGEFAAANRNLVGGDLAGGANNSWQLLARPRLSSNPYATAAPGVYLCSASVAPGGGVHGMGGFGAARRAVRDLDGVDRRSRRDP